VTKIRDVKLYKMNLDEESVGVFKFEIQRKINVSGRLCIL